MSLSVKQRIRRRIYQDERGCHIWTGSVRFYNNPQIRFKKRTYSVVKLRWMLKYGYWPKQLNHHCDEARCVRLSHVYEGTQKENVRDMHTRGRWRSMRTLTY